MFLHDDLIEEIFMMQPPGFVHPEFPNHVCKLEKALYGLKQSPCAWFTKLKQSPCAWFTKLSHALSQWSFTSFLADSSMFIYKSNSIFLVILIYVDDIITVTHSESISQLVLSLGHHFAIKDLRPLHYFLVIKVHRSTSGLHLSWHKYITDLLARTSMTDSKSFHSPMAAGSALSIHDGTPLEDGTTYRSVVGALQYCTLTRPNISFVVNKVCQFMRSPFNVHWQAIKRILRYLKGTSHYGLSIQATLYYNLTCFTDADYASSPDDRRSTSGYCVFMGSTSSHGLLQCKKLYSIPLLSLNTGSLQMALLN